MQEQLRALITRHCTTLATELGAIDGCLSKLDDAGAGADEILTEGIEHAHKIKGSSGSIGFAEISTAAAALERCLRSLLANQGTISDADRAQVATSYDHLRQLVTTVRPETSSLYNAALPTAR